MRWTAWTNTVMGALLVIAPFALGYNTVSRLATGEAVVVGLLIAAVSLWSALSTVAPVSLDYFATVLGAWSVVAPFVLGYASIALMARNADMIAGIVVAVLAIVSRFYESPISHRKATA
jgi:hypothetical protein